MTTPTVKHLAARARYRKQKKSWFAGMECFENEITISKINFTYFRECDSNWMPQYEIDKALVDFYQPVCVMICFWFRFSFFLVFHVSSSFPVINVDSFSCFHIHLHLPFPVPTNRLPPATLCLASVCLVVSSICLYLSPGFGEVNVTRLLLSFDSSHVPCTRAFCFLAM